MSDDYTPIDCATYSQYELWIMHRQLLRIEWRDVDDMSHIDVIRPTDLRTRKDGEFLLAETRHGDALKLRLEHILKAHPVD